jgi:hypothetical protein
MAREGAEFQPPAGSGCSCTSLALLAAQTSGVILGAIAGGKRSLFHGVVGAAVGLAGGTVLALLGIAATGAVVFALAWVTERCCRESRSPGLEEAVPRETLL